MPAGVIRISSSSHYVDPEHKTEAIKLQMIIQVCVGASKAKGG